MLIFGYLFLHQATKFLKKFLEPIFDKIVTYITTYLRQKILSTYCFTKVNIYVTLVYNKQT